MNSKSNLLVIGASGGVANAFLHHLGLYRNYFDKLVLLDKNKKVLSDPYIDHKLLKYTFIHKEIILPEQENKYREILQKYKINIVLDITDMNSLEIIEATDKMGISYINTAMNNERKTVVELLFDILPRKKMINHAPHILCTGMNPGNVNMWVRYGIEKFGRPEQIVHFEYDTSKTAKKWHPMMTWSIHEFLVESVRDPSGEMMGRGKVNKLLPNALENRKNMKGILEPIMKSKVFPEGLTVLHEENLSISYKYDIPSKFIYAINQETMRDLINLYEKKGNVTKEHLKLGNNTKEILEGSDSIGVILDYPDKKVYYFNSIPNLAIIGTNATYTQVAIGIFSAIFTLLFDKLEPQVYFVEDLYDSHYKSFMFDNMRVQEFVFKKNKKKLKLISYNPMIKIKRTNHFEHLYII
jgi:homospermidine synthase